jgi:hypothetical protein
VTENFDLFGNPYVEKPTKRGRPPHEVTKKTRNRVSMLVALGWANPRIAAALGVTLPTLHKHYFYELRQRELAEAGNVGAFKEFGKLLERNDRMEIEREMGANPKEDGKSAAAERVGKKVIDKQRAIDADADLMAELEREASHNVGHC